jgi:hypothetical protein
MEEEETKELIIQEKTRSLVETVTTTRKKDKRHYWKSVEALQKRGRIRKLDVFSKFSIAQTTRRSKD